MHPVFRPKSGLHSPGLYRNLHHACCVECCSFANARLIVVAEFVVPDTDFGVGRAAIRVSNASLRVFDNLWARAGVEILVSAEIAIRSGGSRRIGRIFA